MKALTDHAESHIAVANEAIYLYIYVYTGCGVVLLVSVSVKSNLLGYWGTFVSSALT